MKTLFSFLILALYPLISSADWMDRSHTIFLPSSIHNSLALQMEFSNTWWNFVIIEPKNEQSDFELAQKVCQQVDTLTGTLLQKTGCPDIKSFLPLLHDWSRDLFLRQLPPPSLASSLQSAQANASLPMDRTLLEILRADPLESYLDLKHLMMKNVEIGLEQQRGFFVDPATQKIVIPLQFNFPPQETAKTHVIENTVNKVSPHQNPLALVGPHLSASENESQIMKDVDIISWIGTAIMLLQLAFIFITRRKNYLWLIPPVVVGVGGAVVSTVLIFGSIHGLTLSLGTGLIGLALDFGLHSAHNIRWKGVWRANLFGLLTTFAGLLSIALSGIPLLRQMMVFASLGLVYSYSLYYFMHSRFPERFHVRAFNYKPQTHILKTSLSVVLVLMAFIGLFGIRPNLNMNQFDFQSPKTHSNLYWLYSLINKQMPLFSVHEKKSDLFSVAENEISWAQSHQIVHSNFAQFLPNPNEQLRFSQAWLNQCHSNSFTLETRQLFKPFFEAWPCQTTPTTDLLTSTPTYLRDLVSEKNWLTVWFPKTENEISEIKKMDPKAYSLKEVVQQFPTTLETELQWMLPLSLGLCLLLLFWYYKKQTPSLISLVPFLSGVGLYFSCVVLLGWSFSFISIISLIMVFGFSIDYGIFATNLYILKNPPQAEGVWTCLLLAATVTLLGFLPLVFCQHPVLIHLGQTLVAGTVGTLIGTIWGIPGIFALDWFTKDSQ